MHEQQFYHEVLGPLIALRARTAENVCVTPDCNDVISLAKQSAAAAYHFREPILRSGGRDRVPRMGDQSAEDLRQRLADVVDTAKHGTLRDPDRTVTFSAALAFEGDDQGRFRYLRTEVLATNKRWSTFELADTIQDFSCALSVELDIRLNLNIDLPTHPFIGRIETFVTAKSGLSINSMRFRTYRRDAAGTLVAFDPPNGIELAIFQIP